MTQMAQLMTFSEHLYSSPVNDKEIKDWFLLYQQMWLHPKLRTYAKIDFWYLQFPSLYESLYPMGYSVQLPT